MLQTRKKRARAGSRAATALALAFAALFLSTAGSALGAGEISQVTGPGSCLREDSADREYLLFALQTLRAEKEGFCQKGRALRGAQGVAASPDGRSVYVVSASSGSVVSFRRDAGSGRLTQLPGRSGCISANGTTIGFPKQNERTEALLKQLEAKRADAMQPTATASRPPANPKHAMARRMPCRRGRGLKGPGDIVVSADGNFVYVAAYSGDAIAAFSRDPESGRLTQLPGADGCISEEGEGGCAKGHHLEDAYSLALSPDGRNLYVATYSSRAVVTMRRDPVTGALTQPAGAAGCISDVGSHGRCGHGNALKEATGVVVSPDGRNVYVASFDSNAVATFDRDPQTGALTQRAGAAGCVATDGEHGCASGNGLEGAETISISPNGKSVYVAAASGNSVSIFDRDAATGTLTQKTGTAGCLSSDRRQTECGRARGILEANDAVVSTDETQVYVASGADQSVVVFDRDPLTGALVQKPGPAGCISESRSTRGACRAGHGLLGANRIALSPDGANLYVSSAEDGVAVFDRGR
jgi:DNA-binding beta-propeller fold protein YncE